jgi:hypothetical protein
MKEEQQEQKLYNVSITPKDPNGIGLNFEAGILLQHYNDDNSIIFVLKSPKKKIQSDDLEFVNIGNKESQKELIKEIMDLDAKDGLYEDEVDKLAHQYNPVMKLDAEFIRAGFKAGYKKAKEIQKEQFQPEISDEEIDNAVVKEYENVGDEKLFPNHTDKDIWMNGFCEGIKWYREQLKRNI